MKPQLLSFDGLLGPGVGGFSSTRQGGSSSGAFNSLNLGTNTGDDPASVLKNRRAAFEAAGLDAGRCVYLEQVHGKVIQKAEAFDAGKGLERFEEGMKGTDAVFTRERGLALAIGHADCLAVVLVDVEASILGVAHAGWRGALAKLPAELAKVLFLEGAKPQRLKALLSPCLSPAGLELSEKEHQLFSQAFGSLNGMADALKEGKFHLDLKACAVRQLLEAGLEASQIVSQPLYSDAQADLFFSYRRDQGKTGRMLTTAFLK